MIVRWQVVFLNFAEANSHNNCFGIFGNNPRKEFKNDLNDQFFVATSQNVFDKKCHIDLITTNFGEKKNSFIDSLIFQTLFSL